MNVRKRQGPPNTQRSGLGAAITRCRLASNMTQQELADTIGVDKQTIYRWEGNLCTPATDKLIQMVLATTGDMNDVLPLE